VSKAARSWLSKCWSAYLRLQISSLLLVPRNLALHIQALELIRLSAHTYTLNAQHE